MRILKVVALLLALGAVAGAVTGLLLMMGILLLGPGRVDFHISDLAVFGYAAGFGAMVGAGMGPPIALIFLRRVPLWRATVETAAAAGFGAALGMTIRLPLGVAGFALALALLAAARLRRVYRDKAPAVAGGV